MLRRINAWIGDLSGLGELVGFAIVVIVGIAGMGYVGMKWCTYFFQQGHYLICAGIGLAAIVISAAAVLRIPIALFLVFGGSALVGTAFITDTANILLP